LSEIWNLSGNLSYAERTPDSAELYSDGAHHATESYEIGNPNLDTESAFGVEIIVRKTVGKVTGQFSAFHTKFNDYIFTEDSGKKRDTEGNLPDEGNSLIHYMGFQPILKHFRKENMKQLKQSFRDWKLKSIGWLWKIQDGIFSCPLMEIWFVVKINQRADIYQEFRLQGLG
jgi:hypothetical protein